MNHIPLNVNLLTLSEKWKQQTEIIVNAEGNVIGEQILKFSTAMAYK